MECHCHNCTERDAAERKARRLLRSHLNSYQRRLLRTQNCISVRGGVTGDKYRIYDMDAWVIRLRDGRGYCLDVIDDGDEDVTPIADRILAKKILIEADEELFLKTACLTGGE